MSTTYWAVKRTCDGGAHWWNDHTQRWDAFRSQGSLYDEKATARRLAVGRVGRVVKVTRYTRDESRARAEARGEVRALENLAFGYTHDTCFAIELDHLLKDARRRAGVGPR